MLADSINEIMSYIDDCKAAIIEGLISYKIPFTDNIVGVTVIIPKSALNKDLNLDIRSYSHPMQIEILCEYIENHDLDDTLQFLEAVAETKKIRYRDIKVEALETVVGAVNKVLSMNIKFEEED